MRVGNDVVDLRAADNRPEAIHPRFDERVFTAAELDLLGACPDEGARHSLRWTLWAAKESTLKLLRKRTPELPFHPSEFEVRLEGDPGSAAVALVARAGTATVVHGGSITHVRIDRDSHRVHAVATERPGDAVVTGTERIGPDRSTAFASARVRENAAMAAGRLLGAGVPDAGAQDAGAPDAVAPDRCTPYVRIADSGTPDAKIPRVRRGRRGEGAAPVDVSLSHDGSWLAHALVRTGVALAMLVAVAGCSDPTGPDRDLERAAALWAGQDLASYTYVFDQSCFCGFTGPVRLTVTDGAVVAAQSLPGSSDPDTAQDPTWFPTIDELFDRLRSAVESDPVVFLVTYDSILGFPASASVDISEQIADEEYAFEVRDVVPD